MKKKPLIILTGPTAVGKTSLSISLAKKINGSVISADSMQVYKKLDIGSAKIREDEMDGVKHYLIDVLDPKENFDVTIFKNLALQALEEIYAQNKIPIIVGGTGFYIQALLYGIEFGNQEINQEYRDQLEKIALEKGNPHLHDMLKEIDPKSAEAIHENNVKRVIRAIEYFKLTGKPISEHNEEQKQHESPYNFAYFVLNDDREKLYERIDKRVDIMVDQGLVEEVKELKALGLSRGFNSMQGIGYKEILDYLDEKCTLDEAVEKVKQESRRFAKRQLTWFRREKEVIWFDRTEFDSDEKILDSMLKNLYDKNILERN